MSNWFYYDSNAQKQGPYTSAQFKELAKQGVITPDTMIETEEGKTAPARRMKGLTFGESARPQTTPFGNITYCCTDKNGYKYDSIDQQQLLSLAAQGLITPATLLETNVGDKGLAGEMFPPNPFSALHPWESATPTTSPPPSTAMPTVQNNRNATSNSSTSVILRFGISFLIMVFISMGIFAVLNAKPRDAKPQEAPNIAKQEEEPQRVSLRKPPEEPAFKREMEKLIEGLGLFRAVPSDDLKEALAAQDTAFRAASAASVGERRLIEARAASDRRVREFETEMHNANISATKHLLTLSLNIRRSGSAVLYHSEELFHTQGLDLLQKMSRYHSHFDRMVGRTLELWDSSIKDSNMPDFNNTLFLLREANRASELNHNIMQIMSSIVEDVKTLDSTEYENTRKLASILLEYVNMVIEPSGSYQSYLRDSLAIRGEFERTRALAEQEGSDEERARRKALEERIIQELAAQHRREVAEQQRIQATEQARLEAIARQQRREEEQARQAEADRQALERARLQEIAERQRQDRINEVAAYRRDADQGNADAMYSLALRLFTGDGTNRNEREAIEWLRRATESGHSKSQQELGKRLFERGMVFWNATNYAEALVWLRDAAEQENADAMQQIGLAYNHGLGVSMLPREAGNWFRAAANQRNVDAAKQAQANE